MLCLSGALSGSRLRSDEGSAIGHSGSTLICNSTLSLSGALSGSSLGSDDGIAFCGGGLLITSNALMALRTARHRLKRRLMKAICAIVATDG